jgi:hypothetical protein
VREEGKDGVLGSNQDISQIPVVVKESDLLQNKRSNNEDTNFSMTSIATTKLTESTPVTESVLEPSLSGK